MVYRDILLFAGQGSSTFGSDHVNARTADILASSHTANSLLKACHEALLTELDTLDDNDKRILPDGMRSSFNTPESLVDPPSRLCSNPVVQGTTLFIHQMLEFIAYESALNSPRELAETSGFCSGVLAAIVTASCPSPSSSNFVDTAVHVYRLSFWIGLRNGLFCRRVIGGSRDGSSWSLTVLGMLAHELEGLVDEYNKAVSPGPHPNQVRRAADVRSKTKPLPYVLRRSFPRKHFLLPGLARPWMISGRTASPNPHHLSLRMSTDIIMAGLYCSTLRDRSWMTSSDGESASLSGKH